MNAIQQAFERLLRAMAWVLAGLSGMAIVGMMGVTCADVVMRAAGQPIKGSYDLECILSVITLAGALPYTTAVKGHVAVEYFFHKLPHRSRVVVDSVMRILSILLFSLLAYQCFRHGTQMQRVNELMPTLLWPAFWVPWLIAISCAISALVVVYHLVFPGKAIMRP